MIKYFIVGAKVRDASNVDLATVTGMVIPAAFLSRHRGQSASMRNARKFLRHRRFKVGNYISGHSAHVEYQHS